MRTPILRGDCTVTVCRAFALAFLLTASPVSIDAALAQQARSTAQRTFSIPAGSLSSALVVFGQQAGIQVSYVPSTAAGRTSPGVSGTMSPNAALTQLLAGTGLSFQMRGANTVVVSNAAGNDAAATVDGAIALDTIDVSGGGGSSAAADLPYQSPGSSAYISGDQISRVPPTNPGDMFRSTPGVMAAGNRVGPSMDLNIRGLQGKDRVAVLVDGTRQSNNSYRGYQGSRNEVYVDPDLLGGIEITKGPSDEPGGIGAMGGVVNMRTLEADDIVKPGQTTGTRIKVGAGSNTIAPPATGTLLMRDKDSENAFGEAWSGSVVSAAKQENYDVLFGFARRTSGNYFAGTKGTEIYYDKDFRGNPRRREISPFKHGDEVFGTSQDVTSFLTKGTLKWGDGHKLETGYIYYNNNYGELNETALAFSVGTGIRFPATQPNIAETTTHTLRTRYSYDPSGNDLIALKAGLWMTDYIYYDSKYGEAWPDLLRFGIKQQALPAHTTTHTYTARYAFKPIDQPLVDFHVDVWTNDGKTNLPPLVATIDTQTTGGEIWNLSRLSSPIGALSFKYGASIAREEGDSYEGVGGSAMVGTRTIGSVFNNAAFDVTSWLRLAGSVRYDRYSIDGLGDNAVFSSNPLQAFSSDGSRVSPTASITITPWDGVQFFAQYANGWRPPTLREVIGITGSIKPNPNLDPETAENYEFGANTIHSSVLTSGDKLKTKLAYFDNSYDDYIVRAPAIVSGVTGVPYTWANIPQAHFRGIEGQASYDAGVWFGEASLTYYTDVTYCYSDNFSPAVCRDQTPSVDYGSSFVPPKYSGSVTLGGRFFEQALTLGSRVTFAGARAADATVPSTTIPYLWAPYAIVDVFGSYRLTEEATINFSVENIADRYYVDAIGNSYMPAPGRTVRTGLTLRF